MNYEDVWQLQDEITAAVNALGYSIWDLHFDRLSFAFVKCSESLVITALCVPHL